MSGLGGLNKSPNGVVVGMVQLQLHQADDDAVRRLVQTPQTTHRDTPSSIGAPFRLRLGEQVQIRIASVST